jgi:hypothetical protein
MEDKYIMHLDRLPGTQGRKITIEDAIECHRHHSFTGK